MDLFQAKLKSSGLTLKDAELLGIEKLGPKTVVRCLPFAPPVSALKLRYFAADRSRLKTFRLRLLESPPPGPFGQVSEMRYLQPKGAAPAAYFPRTVLWPQVFADLGQRIIITEGELKAACAAKHGFPTIGLGGVSNWRSAKLGWDFLPELGKIPWARREVVVVFDSDASTNPQVAAEIAKLCQALRYRGALPRVAVLPALSPDTKTGVDDFIVARGPDAFKSVLDHAEGDELAADLWGMNARYLLLCGPDILYDEQHKVQLNPRKAATSALANVWSTKHEGDKIKKVLTVKEWLGWEHRRDLRQFTYAPGRPTIVGDEYNLWPGWGCEEREGDIGPWLKLLDHLFGTDTEAREWLLRWLAFPIQNPGAKMATAVLLWGLGQGVGKSLFGSSMRHIYGTANYSAINQHEFEGGYTAWGTNKQFVLVDDVSSVTRKDARDNAAVLKTRITQEFLTVNIKYVAHYTLPDTINYFLTSNRPDALYLDEQDRRFFVHEVKADKLSEAARAQYQRWRDGKGPSALLYYLRRLPLSGFDRFTEPPMSAAKRAMTHLTHTDVEAWCAVLRTEPGAVLKLGERPCPGDLFTSTQLLAMFASRSGVNSVTPQAMGLALSGAGFVRRIVAVSGTSHGLYAVRNVDKWANVQSREWAAHYAKYGVR